MCARLCGLAVATVVLIAASGCAPEGSAPAVPKNVPAPSVVASTSPTTNPDPRLSPAPDLPAPELDAFIAKQYPAYEVVERVSFPDQWDKGLLSVNYLLAAEHEPRFRILVSLAELGTSDEAASFVSSHYTQRVGRVLSDDGAFSLDAARLHPILSRSVQDSLADAFLSVNSEQDVIVYKAHLSGEDLEIRFASGGGGMSRAMQDNGGFGHAWGYFTISDDSSKTAVVFTPGQ